MGSIDFVANIYTLFAFLVFLVLYLFYDCWS